MPAGREPEQLCEPREGDLLELLQRRGRPPENPHVVEAGDEQLGEDRGLGGARGEVREEARALPVREAGQQHVVEVAEDVRERLALLRGVRRKRGADVAGLDLREHRELPDALQVALEPLERGRAVARQRRTLAVVRAHRVGTLRNSTASPVPSGRRRTLSACSRGCIRAGSRPSGTSSSSRTCRSSGRSSSRRSRPAVASTPRPIASSTRSR